MKGQWAVRTLLTAALTLAGAGFAASQPAPPGPPGGRPTGPESRERVLELAHQVVASAAIDTLPKQLKAF